MMKIISKLATAIGFAVIIATLFCIFLGSGWAIWQDSEWRNGAIALIAMQICAVFLYLLLKNLTVKEEA